MSLLLLLGLISIPSEQSDSVHKLAEIEIVAPVKQQGVFEQCASQSVFGLRQIENRRIETPKDLSFVTPNFYQPNYGSKMTSSMYVRGLGTRIDHPSVALYVDNIPVLNKNAYDFDFYDIGRVEMMRGPQGTLYGRNATGGVINVFTMSPFSYEGTRFSASYGNENTFDVGLSVYKKITQKVAMSISLHHRQSDGFFTNVFDGEKADNFIADGARMRYLHLINQNLTANYILSFNSIRQNGFAYSKYDLQTNEIQPINHNDPCLYDRLAITNGLTFRYHKDNIIAESSTSFQYLKDRMILDQDFLPQSYFTLIQKQNEKTVTQEFVVKSNSVSSGWQWIGGIFGFYRSLRMNAPVTFKQTGIDSLILANANRGIQNYLDPTGAIEFRDNNFTIFSDFTLPNFGVSAYHQSSYNIGNLTLTAGLRFDFEHTFIDYKNYSEIFFRYNKWQNQDFKQINSEMTGNKSVSFPELLPKLSVMYRFKANNVYISLARGYKAGGFNTQIFSDILQSKMQADIMQQFGVHPDGSSTIDDVPYKPEYSWNCEIGSSLYLLSNKLTVNTVLFYIDCKNQQLTVFPPGKSTGRKMSNAGHMRSIGAELSAKYTGEKVSLSVDYGYTNAKFLKFEDGQSNYAGNFVPYAPQNTLAIIGDYNLIFDNKNLEKIVFQITYKGAGRIFWNEDNMISQPFYGLLGAQISLVKGRARINFWAENLTNTEYNTFYFKSIGNSFVQRGTPLQAGIAVSCEF
ncbi:MAG: TonB-dependent receptor [Prevotellaceae bacterium]|jgi:outer membrane receptor protein involved in Fe transport|nr:TonB-dependent receptor [Prevotellaceae bacterium]